MLGGSFVSFKYNEQIIYSEKKVLSYIFATHGIYLSKKQTLRFMIRKSLFELYLTFTYLMNINFFWVTNLFIHCEGLLQKCHSLQVLGLGSACLGNSFVFAHCLRNLPFISFFFVKTRLYSCRFFFCVQNITMVTNFIWKWKETISIHFCWTKRKCYLFCKI